MQPAPRPAVPAPAPAPAPSIPSSVFEQNVPPAEPAYTAPAPEVAPPPRSESNLPTLEELLLSNAITLEPLRLDIHVYSENPDERFVFINMNRYNEGQTLNEGPTLLAIDPAGIVLRHQGYDFLMTRD